MPSFCHSKHVPWPVLLGGGEYNYWIQVRTQTWTYWTRFERFGVQVCQSSGPNLVVKVRVWLKRAQTQTELNRSQFNSSIPFHTCILCDLPKSDDTLPYQPLSLGWHPSEHKSKPTTGDYGKYQATLDHLFSRPYARATLLESGIIWHIALSYLRDCKLNVTHRPSLDATSLGERWVLQSRSVMYDDKLCKLEKDVICGVDKIATSRLLYY